MENNDREGKKVCWVFSTPFFINHVDLRNAEEMCTSGELWLNMKSQQEPNEFF